MSGSSLMPPPPWPSSGTSRTARAFIRSSSCPRSRRSTFPIISGSRVANVLGRRIGHTAAENAERIAVLDGLGLVTDPIDRPLVLLSLDAMARHALTAYDAAYLALAIDLDAGLLTLDARLAAAAGDRDVLGSRGRVSEPAGAYASEAPLATWAGFGAYLAKLRADAAR